MNIIKYKFMDPRPDIIHNFKDGPTYIFRFYNLSNESKSIPQIQINVYVSGLVWGMWEIADDEDQIKVCYFLACEAIKKDPLKKHQEISLTTPLQRPCDPADIKFPDPPPCEVQI